MCPSVGPIKPAHGGMAVLKGVSGVDPVIIVRSAFSVTSPILEVNLLTKYYKRQSTVLAIC